MRIISGIYGRRLFKSPPGNRTHPMGERIKTALFNSLGDVNGEYVLDAFAGSGALGFEALSRGASHVTLIETSPKAFKTIKDNMDTLGIDEEKCYATRANTSSWLDNNPDKIFTLIFADPPFTNLLPHIIVKLARHLAPNGRLIVNWPSTEDPLRLPGLKIIRQKAYAGAQLVYYEQA